MRKKMTNILLATGILAATLSVSARPNPFDDFLKMATWSPLVGTVLVISANGALTDSAPNSGIQGKHKLLLEQASSELGGEEQLGLFLQAIDARVHPETLQDAYGSESRPTVNTMIENYSKVYDREMNSNYAR